MISAESYKMRIKLTGNCKRKGLAGENRPLSLLVP
jgi:hypothetical protein